MMREKDNDDVDPSDERVFENETLFLKQLLSIWSIWFDDRDKTDSFWGFNETHRVFIFFHKCSAIRVQRVECVKINLSPNPNK